MCNGKNTIEMQQDSNLELPPGFRFHPTDDELVSFYLVRKISNPQVVVKTIPNVDLNKCEPWDLPGIFSFRIILQNIWCRPNNCVIRVVGNLIRNLV